MADQIDFTPDHHALLFAFIAKALDRQAGRKTGDQILPRAVRVYGEERGRRMAKRARSFGFPLTMETFLALGEWDAPKGQMTVTLAQRTPHARFVVRQCPWYTAWEKEDYLFLGKRFCQEIDAALVRGFNPDLTLEVQALRPEGGASCDFLFKEANLTLVRLIRLAFRKKVFPGKRAVMPWEYHTAHLFFTLTRGITDALKDQGKAVASSALQEFEARFSKDHGKRILAYGRTDFTTLESL